MTVLTEKTRSIPNLYQLIPTEAGGAQQATLSARRWVPGRAAMRVDQRQLCVYVVPLFIAKAEFNSLNSFAH